MSILLLLWKLCEDGNTWDQHRWHVEESSWIVPCPLVTFPEVKVLDSRFCGPSRIFKPLWLDPLLGCCSSRIKTSSNLSCYWFEFLKRWDASVGQSENIVPLVPAPLVARQSLGVHVLSDSPFSCSITCINRFSRVEMTRFIIFLGNWTFTTFVQSHITLRCRMLWERLAFILPLRQLVWGTGGRFQNKELQKGQAPQLVARHPVTPSNRVL